MNDPRPPTIPPPPPTLPGERYPLPAPQPAYVPQPVYAPQPEPRQREGCVWGLAGALGCLLVLLLPLLAAVVLGVTTIGNVVSSVQNAFQPGATTFNAVSVLENIRELSQLTTVRYNYSTLVTSEREMPAALKLLYGERLMLVAAGHVDAGINLGLLGPDNFRLDGSVLTVTLPPPALQNCVLNEQGTYTFSRDTGIFNRSQPNIETEARRYAVEQFRTMALEGGILNEVQAQSTDVLRRLLEMAAGEQISQVVVQPQPPDAAAPLPETCQ